MPTTSTDIWMACCGKRIHICEKLGCLSFTRASHLVIQKAYTMYAWFPWRSCPGCDDGGVSHSALSPKPGGFDSMVICLRLRLGGLEWEHQPSEVLEWCIIVHPNSSVWDRHKLLDKEYKKSKLPKKLMEKCRFQIL